MFNCFPYPFQSLLSHWYPLIITQWSQTKQSLSFSILSDPLIPHFCHRQCLLIHEFIVVHYSPYPFHLHPPLSNPMYPFSLVCHSGTLYPCFPCPVAPLGPTISFSAPTVGEEKLTGLRDWRGMFTPPWEMGSPTEGNHSYHLRGDLHWIALPF